jgi:hypothetical protein
MNNIIAYQAGVDVVPYYNTIVYYNCFWENSIVDTVQRYFSVEANPLFADTANRDYSLRAISPCIDRGRDKPEYLDPDGTRNDLGALPFNYVLPVPTAVNFTPDFDHHLIDHTPNFYWTYHDTLPTSQSAFELQVGSDLLSFSADMWSILVDPGADTSVEYGGGPLVDGRTYYYRLRVDDGSGWGDWVYSFMHMNSRPAVPMLRSPINDFGVYADSVDLLVDSASDNEEDSLIYDFEIFSDPYASQLVDSQYGSRFVYSATFSGLDFDRRYWWRARSFDLLETSDWSGLASFVTRENTTIIVPIQQPTIQAAITVASSGDTILLEDGYYTGDGNRDLNLLTKSVVIRSRGEPSRVTIDCEGSAADPHRAMVLPRYQDSRACFIGLTFTGGYADSGGAVCSRGSSLTFRNCHFVDNEAVLGGACFFWGGNPVTLEDCLFQRNVGIQGGGVYFTNVVLSMHGCEFIENTAEHGAAFKGLSGQDVVSCLFEGNIAASGGVAEAYNLSRLINCRFIENTVESYPYAVASGFDAYDGCLFANSHGNSYAVYFSPYEMPSNVQNCTFVGNNHAILCWGASPQVEDCIIAYNSGTAMICWAFNPEPSYYVPSNPTLSHCDVFGNKYNYEICLEDFQGIDGNLSVDPRFCEVKERDYHLSSSSPLLTASSEGTYIGAFGQGCGPTGVDPDHPGLPVTLEISQNYPNPFNSSTIIEYAVPTRSDVTIDLFNILGQRVRTLFTGLKSQGRYVVEWDGRDEVGNPVATGLYLYRLRAGDQVKVRKMLLLK